MLNNCVDTLDVVFFRLNQLLNMKLTHHTPFSHLKESLLVLLNLNSPVDKLLEQMALSLSEFDTNDWLFLCLRLLVIAHTTLLDISSCPIAYGVGGRSVIWLGRFLRQTLVAYRSGRRLHGEIL